MSRSDFEAEFWSPVPATVEEYIHDQPVDPIDMFFSLAPVLVEKARSAEIHADSWRGFNVTASAQVYDEQENRTGIITAANYKARISEDERHETDVDDIPPVCAETDIIHTAEELGYSTTIGIFIAATSNKQKIFEVTKRHASTLAPCGRCRHLGEQSRVIHPGTFVMPIGMVRNIWQFYTADGLSRAYSKPATEFIDPPVRTYNPVEWTVKQQDYRNRLAKLGLSEAFKETDVSRSRAHLKVAQRAIEF